MNRAWYLFLCMFHAWQLHGMEPKIPSLMDTCIRAIGLYLLEDELSPHQVVYSLPFLLVDRIKKNLPQMHIKKSPFNKCLNGDLVFKIIDGRYLWLLNCEQEIFRLLDTKTKVSKESPCSPYGCALDATNLSIIGFKNDHDEMKWYNFKDDKEYTVTNYYFDLNQTYFIKLRSDYVIIKQKGIIGIYQLHFNDNNTITLEFEQILPSCEKFIPLNGSKILIQPKFNSPIYSNWIIHHLHIEKQWLVDPCEFTVSKDKKLIAYSVPGKETVISSLAAIPNKHNCLPALMKLWTTGIIKFLADSSYIVSFSRYPNVIDVRHWPTDRYIGKVYIKSRQAIEKVFTCPEHVEVLVGNRLHRLYLDFLKTSKIKRKLDEAMHYLQKEEHINQTQRQSLSSNILKSTALLFASPSSTAAQNLKDTID